MSRASFTRPFISRILSSWDLGAQGHILLQLSFGVRSTLGTSFMTKLPHSQVTSDDIRALYQRVKDLEAGKGLRSPARLFHTVYKGYQSVHGGLTSSTLVHARRMVIELEGMWADGHFPRSGVGQQYHDAVVELSQWIRDVEQQNRGGQIAAGRTPEVPASVRRSLRNLLAYVTNYVNRYKRLDGHLPLLGPYSDQQQPHPWDQSPWRDSPYDNQYSH